MKRKEYQKPTMKVLEFQQRHEILVESRQNVGVQNYQMNNVMRDNQSYSLPEYRQKWGSLNPEDLTAE